MTEITMTERQQRIDNGLEHASNSIGDITRPVMDKFYSQFPDARQSFEDHGLGQTTELETQMVGNILYCLMYWHVRPLEIEILFAGSVPHHEETLDIPHEFYSGMIIAAVDVIVASFPDNADEDKAVWKETAQQLTQAIAASKSEFAEIMASDQ